MRLIESLDFWLAILTVGFAAYFLIWKDRLQPFLQWLLPSRPAESARPQAEIEPKEDETASEEVSGIETTNNDPETVSLQTILKLVEAKLVTESAALHAVFGVNAGGGKEYKRITAKLKTVRSKPTDMN